MSGNCELHFDKRNILGIEIYDTNRYDLLKVLEGRIENGKKTVLFGVSAAAFGRLKYRPDLFGIYQKMDILIAEGAGLPLFAKSFGVKISEKIGLVNVVFDLLKLANQKRYRVLFFGASMEVNAIVTNRIKTQYPNIHVCKGINGYFQESDLPGIIEKINIEKPDILLIGITYPIKERFSIKFKNKLQTKLIVPCGGAFDVIAGKVKKNKEFSKRIPTAWLVRFLQEPIRLFKPVILTIGYSLFIMYPKLLFRHYFQRRNPSIADYFKITSDEWDSVNGSIKDV